ncbi:peptidylprolyl isomerase [Neobacillus cucumis]|uniref:Peptidyl-prolyl cis-trans isomerase n=1 Tax=Neobacillus cucumis TaxID=1740721 RepID=A0A2N5H755_9BACI|nr:peptidylprolyl isomerase [Neobacillus cucumis]PLS01350.1 peptidylprolyl isomerase [Neobacillus cucumis]
MSKKWPVIFIFLTIVLVLAACGTSQKKDETATESKTAAPKTEQKEGAEKQVSDKAYPQLSTEVAENEKLVEMETTMGTIKIKLFPEYAPKAVENFVKHSQKGYYDGLIFHRVIKDFMIQGGDPKGDGTGGESIWKTPFEDEFSNNLFNLRGALSMANAGANTNGSQFFIVQKTSLDSAMKTEMEKAGYPKEIIDAYDKNGGTPWLDHRHTVFGQVIEGMDIVDKIADTPVDAKDKPEKDVVIKGVKVLK